MDYESRDELLAYIASLYYDQNKNQQEIADEVGVTRSAVSRLLTEARERGIVQVIVNYPWRRVPDLEKELQQTFQLKAVQVLAKENKTYDEMLTGLGILAARFLSEILNEQAVIGISWGTALQKMIRAINSNNFPTVEVVQLIGATGSEKAAADGPLLAQMLANKLGCNCRYLHAPLIVETETLRESLVQERSIHDTLQRAKNANIALVGIGSTVPELSSLLRTGYLDRQKLEQMRMDGAVGDVCAQFFDIHGRLLDLELNRRVMGIRLEDLKQVETVIGVAGDARKTDAILGALRGCYVNVLITDDQTAAQLLRNNR